MSGVYIIQKRVKDTHFFIFYLQNWKHPLIFNSDIPNIICLNFLKHPVWQIDINTHDHDSYRPYFDMVYDATYFFK